MDPKHLRFMDLAGQISQEKMHAGEGGPFGAIIVRDDQDNWPGLESSHISV